MRKFRFILPLTTLLLLSSCAELMYISVEQMLPPEIMPEPAVCSIGVVSNFSQNNVVIVNDNAIILPCDADSVKEQVAQAFGMCEEFRLSVLLTPGSCP